MNASQGLKIFPLCAQLISPFAWASDAPLLFFYFYFGSVVCSGCGWVYKVSVFVFLCGCVRGDPRLQLLHFLTFFYICDVVVKLFVNFLYFTSVFFSCLFFYSWQIMGVSWSAVLELCAWSDAGIVSAWMLLCYRGAEKKIWNRK